MREDGFVTLWLGESSSVDALEEYVRLSYSEDGDVVPSQLMRAFSIPRYDEDFCEAERLQQPERRIRSLLQGFSYDEVITPSFARICGELVSFDANVVILLYNYRVRNPSVANVDSSYIRLQLMGVAEYRR